MKAIMMHSGTLSVFERLHGFATKFDVAWDPYPLIGRRAPFPGSPKTVSFRHPEPDAALKLWRGMNETLRSQHGYSIYALSHAAGLSPLQTQEDAECFAELAPFGCFIWQENDAPVMLHAEGRLTGHELLEEASDFHRRRARWGNGIDTLPLKAPGQ